MKRSTKVIATIAGAVVLLGAGTGVALGAASDDDAGEVPITGAALERASRAALDHTGGGRVTDTEVGDEESYYEVEVRRPDGTSVDVQLDESFTVVSSESDDDRSED